MSESNFAVSSIGEYFIYAIPVFGILLVVVGDPVWKFSQTWIWLSLLLYVVAIGISHSILIPGHKRINALLAEMEQGPADRGWSAAAGSRTPGDRQEDGRGGRDAERLRRDLLDLDGLEAGV